MHALWTALTFTAGTLTAGAIAHRINGNRMRRIHRDARKAGL